MSTTYDAPESTTALPKELPFTPGWVDYLQSWVDRTGLPLWVFYLLLWLAILAIGFILQWRGPNEPPIVGQFEIVLTASIIYVAIVTHYNNRMGGRAFDHFRPALLEMSDEQFARWRYRLTHMPSRSTWLATLAGITFAVLNFVTIPELLRAQWYNFADFPLLTIYKVIFGLLLGISGAIFFLNIFRQSQIIGTILSQHTKINAFEQQPLYTLSGVSGRFALELIGLFFLYFLWYLTDPMLSANSFTTVIGVFYVASMSILLILPMFGVHRLLQAEKNRLIAECSNNMEILIAHLHSLIQARDLAQLDGVNKGLDSLELELQVLRRIPTWPWSTETVRWLVAALLFPLIIWLGQWLLERILQI